ncbi:hypothetical protein CQW23_07130 [Capsicum baccatum]|uniref:Uncharacterized protein n=1 Tax=Capsicum baccatum TaxID=33114 RepID=A0A2G2X5A3_CAPBA|nr:hypothetical protein CQW23_07130 [Capsicum baccatum]
MAQEDISWFKGKWRGREIDHLLTIEYMDLAEQSLQALKKISQVFPSVCLWNGTLMAMLSYLEFFSTRIQEKYDLELEKLVSEIDNSSSEAKLESPRFQLAPWLQNDMLKNDSNVTSLLQVWFYLINEIENDLYCVQVEESYYFLMSLHIKDQGKFELDNLQRDANEIANELCRLKEEMSIDLSLEDMKRVSLHYGFVFEKESTIETTYTTNSTSMLQERPVDGSSIIPMCSPLRGQNDPLQCQSIRGLHYVVDNMLIELLVYLLVSKMKKEMKKMMKTLTVLEKIFGL